MLIKVNQSVCSADFDIAMAHLFICERLKIYFRALAIYFIVNRLWRFLILKC